MEDIRSKSFETFEPCDNPETFNVYANTTDLEIRDQFFRVWSSIKGPLWEITQPNKFVPDHLSEIDKHVAYNEIASIPECFYTKYRVPVITPNNVAMFIDSMSRLPGFNPVLWTWFSGSSNLAAHICDAPYHNTCLFPVDLRYGWDISLKAHQLILLKLDDLFKPVCTTFEPRCKFWSIAGSKRDPGKTHEYRTQEQPMLSFVTKHIQNIHKNHRLWWCENPKTSAMWSESPLVKLDYIKYADKTDQDLCNGITAMCAHSDKPDGMRSRKLTRMRGTVRLFKTKRVCNCQYPHEILEGIDPDTGLNKTATAAAYSHKFCGNLCKDIMDTAVYRNLFALDNTFPVSCYEIAPVSAPVGDIAETIDKMNVEGISFKGIDADAQNFHRCLQDKSVTHLKSSLVCLFDEARTTMGHAPNESILYIDSGVSDTNKVWTYLKQVIEPAFSVFHLVYIYIYGRTTPNSQGVYDITGLLCGSARSH
jgi:hypothetical protein